jgi:heptosyltransferase-2
VSAPRLLIRLGSLGDVILATGAATALRDRDPASPVDVLVKSEWAAVWENHPAVATVHRLEESDRGPAGIGRWASRLRERRYAEAVDLQASPRTRLLTALAGIAHVRRPRRYSRERRRLVRTKTGGPPAGHHVLGAYLEAVGPGATGIPSLHPGEAARGRAAERLAGAGETALAPGAHHATKRWPVSRYALVGRALHERDGHPVPVFGAPGDDLLFAELEEVWPEREQWIPVREEFEVAAAALARCAVLVTGDTGLMHAAAAVGTRTVALFGPTVAAFGFAPVGEGHRIVEVDLSCRPCALHGGPVCPETHFRCQLDITPDAVLAAATGVPVGGG